MDVIEGWLAKAALQLLVAVLWSTTVQGKLIACLCTTNHCQEQQTTRCNTTSMCYSQYLDRRDGSNPLVKGCITSKTPLLCENRKPAVAHSKWPVLVCCNTNMCNQDITPTPLASSETDKTRGDEGTAANMTGAPTGQVVLSDDLHVPSRGPHVISPMYISVLVAGICTLVVIGVVALLVLRRQSRLYDADYSSIERNGYLKGHRQVAREDPDLPLSLPKCANSTYDNKLNVIPT